MFSISVLTYGILNRYNVWHFRFFSPISFGIECVNRDKPLVVIITEHVIKEAVA